LVPAAPPALAAVDQRVERDEIAMTKPRDVRAQLGDSTRDLVPEDEWSLSASEGVCLGDGDEARPVPPLLEVGAADSAPLDCDLDLSRTRAGRLWNLVDAHVAAAVPHDGSHGLSSSNWKSEQPPSARRTDPVM
jgi:hypothetical protein